MEKRRLEYSIQSTEGPLHIARDCLGNRQRRIDYDLVQDQAEKELLKEIELISQVRKNVFAACCFYFLYGIANNLKKPKFVPMFRIRPLLTHEVIHSHCFDDDTLGILRCQHLESGSEHNTPDSVTVAMNA